MEGQAKDGAARQGGYAGDSGANLGGMKARRGRKRKQPDIVGGEEGGEEKQGRGKNYLNQNNCVPLRISEINDRIRRNANDPRKIYIFRSCFSGLLVVKKCPISVPALIEMFKKWDKVAGGFRMNDGTVWKFTVEDVAKVYGLPFGPDKRDILVDDLGEDSGTTYVGKFCEKYNLVKDGERKIHKDVLKKILEDDDMKTNPKHFWRIYVLYALHFLLVPSNSHKITSKYLEYLEDPQVAAQYNWAGHVHDCLVGGIEDMQDRNYTIGRTKGDVFCLMNMFYDYLERRENPGKRQTNVTCEKQRLLHMEDVQSVFYGRGEMKTKRRKVQGRRRPMEEEIGDVPTGQGNRGNEESRDDNGLEKALEMAALHVVEVQNVVT